MATEAGSRLGGVSSGAKLSAGVSVVALLLSVVAVGWIIVVDGIRVYQCWDRDQDRIADPLEDVNGDGVWDVGDCQGTPGVCPGCTNGQNGTDGQDGFHCWDLDMDRVDDAAEDTTGDGVWDVEDCRGTGGGTGGGLVLATRITGVDVAFSGCTNFDAVTIAVPANGTVILQSLVKLTINHTSGTEDRWALTHETTASDCTNPNQEWMDEVPGPIPSEFTLETSALVQTVRTVTAGTYTFYLNGLMLSGEGGPNEGHDWSNTVAVFYG